MLRDLFRRIPKVELHVHLSGSTPLRLLKRFLREEGWSRRRISRQLHVKERYRTLDDFLRTYHGIAQVRTPEQYRQAAAALVKDAARENVRYLEIRESINYNVSGSPREIVEAMEQGLREGSSWVQHHLGHRIGTGLIISVNRSQPPRVSLEAAKLTVELSRRPGSLICGFDLAGGETDYPVDRHSAALRYLRQEGKPLGLGITIHAGETKHSGPLSGAESVRHALDLGADRIGHGEQIPGDRSLLRMVKRKKIHVELNPWSNVQTGAVSSYEEHPIRTFLKKKARVSLSTDNRTASSITLSRQLEQLYAHHLVTSWKDIKRMTLAGIKAGFGGDARSFKSEIQREFHLLERDPVFRRAIKTYLRGN